MKTVTEIREQPRRAGRYEIFLDGIQTATLSVREIAALDLREGRTVDASLHSRICVANDHLRAYDAALGILGRAPRSTFDLRRRLAKRGEVRASIEWALSRLEQEGVTNDAAFAEQYARSRFGRGAPRSAVLNGLLKVAVPRPLAEEVVNRVAAETGWNESAAAVAAAVRKIRSLRRLDSEVARRRLIGFLRRRGFNASDIRAAVKRAESDAAGD